MEVEHKREQRRRLTTDDFDPLVIIGRGAFGEVGREGGMERGREDVEEGERKEERKYARGQHSRLVIHPFLLPSLPSFLRRFAWSKRSPAAKCTL